MILNNCTTCGRKPEIRKIVLSDRVDYYFSCKCGRTVNSDCKREWTPEVAADMWNRANPVDQEYEDHYINYLAASVAKLGIKPTFDDSGMLEFKGKLIINKNPALAVSLCKYRQELTDFYKNRLQTEAKSI